MHVLEIHDDQKRLPVHATNAIGQNVCSRERLPQTEYVRRNEHEESDLRLLGFAIMVLSAMFVLAPIILVLT